MSELKPVVNQQSDMSSTDEIDLRSLMYQIWNSKIVLIAGFLSGLLFALFYTLIATPVYTSDALLQLETDDSEMGMLSEMIGSGVSISTQSEQEILYSRTILGGTVRGLGLDVEAQPKYFPLIGEAIARRHSDPALAEPIVFQGYAWGGEEIHIEYFTPPRGYFGEELELILKQANQFDVILPGEGILFSGEVGRPVTEPGWDLLVTDLKARPGTTFTLKKMHEESAIEQLRSIFHVKQLGGSRNSKDIIALNLEGSDSQQAAKILDTIISHYIDYKIKADSAVAEKTLVFINQQLEKYANDPTFNPELYMQMTLKAQELKVMKAGELGNVRVIDYPLVPLRPSKPQKGLILLLGGLLGTMLAAVYIVVKVSMDRAIYNPQQIESYLNLPVYATVPVSQLQAKSDKKKSQGHHRSLLYQISHDDPAIEALRFLRTSLETGNLRTKKHSVIGITGPSPDVGKSFISANLSSLISELGTRVLLIDGDIRRGVLHEYFNLSKESGLAEYLAGQREIEEIIRPSGIANMDIISRGELPGNPSVLMNSIKLEELLNQVKPKYDFVIIDTPPALSITDAAIVARYCDRLVIVLRAGKTTIEEVSTCWNRLSHSGVTPSGLVMSGFDAKSHGYGVYKHYGYY